MDENSAFVVFNIVDECGDIFIVQLVSLAQKWIILSMLVHNCYLLDSNALKQLQQFLICATFSPSSSLSTFFFVFCNSFIVSVDISSNLYPVFTLETIRF